MKQCDAKQMKLFSMDAIVNMGFFRAILRWEKHFFRVPMPTVQYWTSGKFKKSHMTAPIIWHSKPDLNESEERGVEKHNGSFSFSGLFHWSTQKKRDPGGPHGWRKDLCVSFGFDSNPEAIPFMRNTNCGLPTYFICYVEYPDTGEESGEETTTEEGMTTIEPGPIDPDDMPLPPEPENETETAEIEAMFAVEGRSLNMSCETNDEKDDISGRNGIVGNYLRWWNGFTVYIDNNYDKNARKLINTAMDRLRKVVCIPFYLFRRNQRPYGDYVHIQDRRSCYSRIGKEGGAQEMSLGRGCLNVGTIMHEMIHALGFWHEQARPDRDKYVNIFWNNIVHNQKYNFYLRNNVLTFGVPYNTVSIMHYRSWEFSANGRDTILDKV
ncbi:Zinc metalloproteinase nas-4 [Orchesella cincta]|uniref:Metalloendopeptidase n=1 Tax=Orchesella cincta TaxID=48709 RepID=A0A1D2MC73_ORCCI|nr:Zinc metalloproteinase nas-4 [Orchesella cincta]